jgi:hypothetical protein
MTVECIPLFLIGHGVSKEDQFSATWVRRLPSQLNGYERWTSSLIGELKYNNFIKTLSQIVSTETLLLTGTELG